MKDIFIAYPQEDKRTVKNLTQKLESAGYSCKVFPRDLRDKSNYKAELENTLENCSMFVLLYSDFSEKSKQLSEQLNLAKDFGLKIVPFKTGSVTSTLSSNLFLHSYEWVDAHDDGFNTAYEILLEIIEELNEGKAPEEQIRIKVKKPKKQPQKQLANIYYYLGAAVVAIALIFIIVYSNRNEKTTSNTNNVNISANQQIDFTDTGNIEDLSPDEQVLVGEWVVSDYVDNQNLPEAERRELRANIMGIGRLIFNADKRFFRTGFTPDVQTAEWSFDRARSTINLNIDGRNEPINLAQFSDSAFTLLTTERTVDEVTGMENMVTTRITFSKTEQ